MSLRNKLRTFCSKLTESYQRRSLQAPSSRARNACRRRARRVRRAPARRPGPDARSRHTHKHPSLPRSSSIDLRWSLFTSPFSVWHSLVRFNVRESSPSGKVLSALSADGAHADVQLDVTAVGAVRFSAGSRDGPKRGKNEAHRLSSNCKLLTNFLIFASKFRR